MCYGLKDSDSVILLPQRAEEEEEEVEEGDWGMCKMVRRSFAE